jgi:hypothetical protein
MKWYSSLFCVHYISSCHRWNVISVNSDSPHPCQSDVYYISGYRCYIRSILSTVVLLGSGDNAGGAGQVKVARIQVFIEGM